MKKFIALAAASGIAVLGVTACGGSHASDSAQIKQVTTQFIEALGSNNPADACQFVTDATKDNCAKAAVILKALGGGSLVKAELPHDWKDRVENAKIIVTGDRATLARNLLGKSSGSGSNFQKIGGQWRLVAKDNVTHG